MPELIERDNVIAYLNAQMEKVRSGWLHDYGFPTNVIASLTDVKNLVKNLPTIEPEVRHGHWGNIPGMNNTVFCSECLAAANKELAMKYKGCPFCLARMDGGADNA